MRLCGRMRLGFEKKFNAFLAHVGSLINHLLAVFAASFLHEKIGHKGQFFPPAMSLFYSPHVRRTAPIAPPHQILASMLLLSVTGYIFSLQFSGVLGCAVCLLHATFRPPVARAVRNSRNGGNAPELHGGDGDLEGGGGGGVGRGRPGPVNANMRLRTRPVPVGAMGGGATTPPRMGVGGGGGFRDGAPPMVDPSSAGRHSHAT